MLTGKLLAVLRKVFGKYPADTLQRQERLLSSMISGTLRENVF